MSKEEAGRPSDAEVNALGQSLCECGRVKLEENELCEQCKRPGVPPRGDGLQGSEHGTVQCSSPPTEILPPVQRVGITSDTSIGDHPYGAAVHPDSPKPDSCIRCLGTGLTGTHTERHCNVCGGTGTKPEEPVVVPVDVAAVERRVLRQETIRALEQVDAEHKGDPEAIHVAADKLLVTCLRGMGAESVALAYEQLEDRVPWWAA